MGWAIVKSSTTEHAGLATRTDTDTGAFWDALDAASAAVSRADEVAFERLRRFLDGCEAPDLDWQFREQMNNHEGLLTMTSSRNHRGVEPTAVRVLRWLSENAPGSRGLVYVHDDEDDRTRPMPDGPPRPFYDEFRVWRLRDGKVDELDDPFLSPIGVRLHEYWG